MANNYQSIASNFRKDPINNTIVSKPIIQPDVISPNSSGIVPMWEIPEVRNRVKVMNVDGTYKVECFNAKDITEEKYFYVDYALGDCYFHKNELGKAITIVYRGIGSNSLYAGRVYTKLGEDGDVTETIQDIITQGRASIDFYNASGSAIVLLEDLTAKNIEASDILGLLNTAIDTGDIVMMQSDIVTMQSDMDMIQTAVNTKANQEDLISTNEDVSATNLRIDTLVINSGDANVEVTDSHVSSVKNTTFTTIKNRFEAIEEGIDFKATNYSINGDLSNGTTGWTGGAGTISSANNILTFTANGTQAFTNYALNDSTLTSAIGKKVYATVQVRVTNSVCQSIVLNIRDSVSNVARTIENPIMNQWYTVSGLVTMSGTGIISVYVYETYADETTANGKVMEVKYLSVLDVTEIFKVGNEPLITELDKLMSYFTNSYISGFTDTIIKYRDLYNNYYELKQDYDEYKAIGIVNKSIGIDKLSDEVYEGIYSPQPITVLPTSFEYDNLTLTYVDSILSASNLARAFHSIFLPNEVAEISFNRGVTEVWLILGGTSTRYTAIKFTSAGISAISEIINSGTTTADFLMLDSSTKWTGAIGFTDIIKVTYKQGAYKFYKNDVLIYTLNIEDITNVNATGFRLNNRMGFVGQKDKSTSTGIVRVITANSYQSAIVGLETLNSDVAELKASQTMMTSQWKDKIWNVLGDSLTYGMGTTKSYHQYIQEDLGITTVNNYGISSTEICTSGTSGDPFIGRYLSMDANADLITVLGGSNDFLHHAELGTFDSRDNSTFYGALHNLCVGLHTNFTNSKIAFFTPLRINGIYGIDTVPNTKGYILEDYVDAIKEVCGFYSIPVLDLFKSSGLSPYIPYMKTNYMPDGTHPNAVGHRMIADKIRAFINSL